MQNSESTGRFFSEDIHDSLETWVYVKTPTCSHCPQIKFHIVSFPNIFLCVCKSVLLRSCCTASTSFKYLITATPSQCGIPCHIWKCGKGHQLLCVIPCDPFLCSAILLRKGLCQGERMSGTTEMFTQQVKQEIMLLLMRIYTTWRRHSLLKETNKAGWTITAYLGKLPRSFTDVPLISDS